MKKILFILCTFITTSVFAIEKDCSSFNTDQLQAKVVSKIQSKDVKSLSINYSADMSKQATSLQSKLQAVNINVKLTQISGTATCEMTDFAK